MNAKPTCKTSPQIKSITGTNSWSRRSSYRFSRYFKFFFSVYLSSKPPPSPSSSPRPPPTTPNLDSQLPFSLALNLTPPQPQRGVELVPLTFSARDLMEPLHPQHGIFLCWALLLGGGSAPNILPNSLVPSHQFPPGTGTEGPSLHHPLPNWHHSVASTVPRADPTGAPFLSQSTQRLSKGTMKTQAVVLTASSWSPIC